MVYYDSGRINEALDVDDVIEKLDLETQWRGSYRFIKCPEHKARTGFEDNNFGNCIVSERGYHCFACGAHGNLLNLIKNVCNNTESDVLKDFQLDPEKFLKENDFSRFPITHDELRIIGLSRYVEMEYPYEEDKFKVSYEENPNVSRKFAPHMNYIYPYEAKKDERNDFLESIENPENIVLENLYVLSKREKIDLADLYNDKEEKADIINMIQNKIIEAYNRINKGLSRHIFSEEIEFVPKILLKNDLEKLYVLAKRFRVNLPQKTA